MDKNCRNYRDTLQQISAKQPKPLIVPYLGLFAKDLFAIEENNSTFLEQIPSQVTSNNGENSSTEPLVNWDKMRKIYNCVMEVVQFQHKKYEFPIDADIFKFLLNLPEHTENELYQISTQVEPKEKSTDFMM